MVKQHLFNRNTFRSYRTLLWITFITLLFSVGFGSSSASSNTTNDIAQLQNNTNTLANGLYWAPPELENPITINVPVGGGSIRMDTSRDYIVVFPDQPVMGGVILNGGRNVVAIGGEINIPWQGSNASIRSRTGVTIYNQTGTIHLEGLLLHGEDISEGFQISADEATVQLQNIAVVDIHARDQVGFTDNHPDLIQTWGNVGELRVDHFTGSTDYQGLFFKSDFSDFDHGAVHLRNVDVSGAPTGRYLLWIHAESGNDLVYWAGDVTLNNVWVNPHENRSGGLANSVWPPAHWGLPMGVQLFNDNGTECGSWSEDMHITITGYVCEGLPVGGNFVDVNNVGLNYVSPGYVGDQPPVSNPPGDDSNAAPTLSTIANRTMTTDQILGIPIVASDVNGDTITLSADAPAFVTLTDNGNGTGYLAANPDNNDLGSYTIWVDATDQNGASTSVQFTLTVASPDSTPLPPPDNPPSDSPSVSSLTLIDANSNTDMMALTDGMSINLNRVSTDTFNVRADVSGDVGSVVFSFDGASNYRTENVAPYALAGDNDTDYFGIALPANTYTLTATPYSGSSGTGTAGTPLTVTFTMTNTVDTPTETPIVPTSTPIVPTSTPIMPTNTPIVPTNTPIVPTSTPIVPTNTPIVPTNTPIVPTNTPIVPTNTPIVPTTVPPTSTPLPPPDSPPTNDSAITSLMLVDADSDTDLMALTDGMSIDLDALSNSTFNVRADVAGNVGSVVFSFNDNSNYRTENDAPYTLFGDFGDDYYGTALPADTYTLTATPYSGPDGTGTAGTPLTITFTMTEVVDEPTEAPIVPTNTPIVPTTAPTNTPIVPTNTPVVQPTNPPPAGNPPGTGTASCDVNVAIGNTWNTGYVATITIRNTSTQPIEGWTLNFDLGIGVSVSNTWNLQTSAQIDSTMTATANDTHYNGTIPARGTVNFGYRASHGGNLVAPDSFVLNGMPCNSADTSDAPQPEPTQPPAGSEPTQAPVQPTTAPVQPTTAPVQPTTAPVQPTTPPSTGGSTSSSCTVNIAFSNEWNSGYTASVTIRNNGNAPIDGWTLRFNLGAGVTLRNAWGSDTQSQSGNIVTMSSTGNHYNATLDPGETITIGFNAGHGGNYGLPTGIRLNGQQC